jgi:hypothetical protein
MKTTESLKQIQQELKAPKGQFNNFGKYKYRSAEDILESVKPLLAKYDCVLTMSDELVNVGARYYVKATVTLENTETDSKLLVTAYAREEEVKKGMDGSQITGASSSYARKYALNGLFAIDDTKDSDSTNTHDKEEKKANDSILTKINTAKTVKDLGVIWSDLNEEEQPLYLDKFTVRKSILQAK